MVGCFGVGGRWGGLVVQYNVLATSWMCAGHSQAASNAQRAGQHAHTAAVHHTLCVCVGGPITSVTCADDQPASVPCSAAAHPITLAAARPATHTFFCVACSAARVAVAAWLCRAAVLHCPASAPSSALRVPSWVRSPSPSAMSLDSRALTSFSSCGRPQQGEGCPGVRPSE